MPVLDESWPSPRRSFGCRLVAIGFALFSLFGARRAHADGALRLGVEWGKLSRLVRNGGSALAMENWRLGSAERSAPVQVTEDLPWGDLRWVDWAPHLELIARDWGDARGLVGNLSVTDRLRLSRSCRMVVTRVKLSEGRVAPFAQVGLGQWRVDTDLMPAVVRDVETAAQFGGGFEFLISRTKTVHAVLAIEFDSTILYREQHEPQMIFPTELLGTLVAARVDF